MNLLSPKSRADAVSGRGRNRSQAAPLRLQFFNMSPGPICEADRNDHWMDAAVHRSRAFEAALLIARGQPGILRLLRRFFPLHT